MIILRKHRLEIQIQEPGSFYQRARFDWSGICQQIILDGADGQHTFCSQEATDDELGTEGIGLIDEFGIATPIGYDQIGVGEWFPKIGVGFLQKFDNAAYSFFSEYPVSPVPYEFEQKNENEVSFTQACENSNGWGWNLHKNFSLEGLNLTMDYALANTGEKALTTEHYNHNFVAINGQTIGPDYQLTTSFQPKFEVLDGGIQVGDNTIGLTEVPTADIYASQSDCTGLQNVTWRLVHQPSGHGLQVSEIFPIFKFAVWAKSHVISPECFIWIDLQPGETQTWKKTYTFF